MVSRLHDPGRFRYNPPGSGRSFVRRGTGSGPLEQLVEIFKVFTIEAAHRLPNLPEHHKCRRLHGHSFRIEIHVSGPIAEHEGWVLDFADIGRAFTPVFEQLDHHYLNEIPGLENPTSENLARWVWRMMQPRLPQLSKVVVRETCTAGCVYSGQ